MEARYPIYLLVRDEFSILELRRADDLDDWQDPDVLDRLYEGWDSAGHHFTVSWDARTNAPHLLVDLETSIDSFSRVVKEYGRGCAESKLKFDSPPRPPKSASHLCDPA